jgi:hypothetical protein
MVVLVYVRRRNGIRARNRTDKKRKTGDRLVWPSVETSGFISTESKCTVCVCVCVCV